MQLLIDISLVFEGSIILCWAMLCRAVPCYAMPCHAMPCHAMLCYATLRYATLRYAMLCYAMLCYAMLCYAMLCSLHVTITCLLVHVPRCQHGRGMLLTDAQRCPCALLRVVGGAVMQALDAGGRDACVTCRAVMQPFGACMSMST